MQLPQYKTCFMMLMCIAVWQGAFADETINKAVEHHVGDLGNIETDNNGHAHLDVVNKDVKFSGKNNIIGRTIIVHADPDACVSKPVGNAGTRVGCGVIGIAK